MTGKSFLILGGARSGKSRYGEALALGMNLAPVYIATAQPQDEEMRARIGHHQSQRDAAWRTIEEPLALADVIAEHARPESVLLVDCLTLWLSNLMEAEADLVAAADDLCRALKNASGPVILISNEVGQGIVPANDLARRFRDEAGRLHQKVAAVCSDVSFIIASLCLPLKRAGLPVDSSPLAKEIP